MSAAQAEAFAAPPLDSLARGLSLPDLPIRVEPAELFAFEVQTASALTPPPGIQEPRAYRGFSVALCSEGIPLGQAPEQLCFALAIANLRPVSSHSLAYRVQAYVPHWVARGRYGLRVRYPGGFEQRSQALQVAGGTRDCTVQAESRGNNTTPSAVELHLRAENCEGEAEARVHFGLGGADLTAASGMLPGVRSGMLSGVRTTFGLTAYPLPRDDGGLGEGALLLVKIPKGQEAVVSLNGQTRKATAEIVRRPPEGGQLGSLRMQGVPDAAQVYWQLSPWESGLGPEVQVRLWGPRASQVTAVVVHKDGATERLTEDVSQLARRRALFACEVTQGPRGNHLDDSSPPWAALSLLFWALSRKLRRRVLGLESRARWE